MADYTKLVQVIQQGNVSETQNQVKILLDQGESPKEIIQNGIIVPLNIVGKMFSAGQCFIPEMLIAARASQKGLDILRPLFTEKGFQFIGKVVIGTVKGDLHDIGKNIVSMMLESAGFEVTDLGVDVFPEKFIEAINTSNPEILALSCLLTTTMESMSLTLAELEEAGIRDNIKVIIGGPPVNHEFAKKIGADFYGEDAYKGVEIARKIVARSM